MCKTLTNIKFISPVSIFIVHIFIIYLLNNKHYRFKYLLPLKQIDQFWRVSLIIFYETLPCKYLKVEIADKEEEFDIGENEIDCLSSNNIKMEDDVLFENDLGVETVCDVDTVDENVDHFLMKCLTFSNDIMLNESYCENIASENEFAQQNQSYPKFKCELCKKIYKNERSLKTHYINAHSNTFFHVLIVKSLLKVNSI
ncbi:uncharacterized protein LOC142331263 isoform X2 [Lycorma delicatula]|uniref:uncharacterized protein LOC142331263 isoform X2 n=1 Tax=Lycorma delicatula TaxID=130591 RepID=UPI003F519DFF